VNRLPALVLAVLLAGCQPASDPPATPATSTLTVSAPAVLDPDRPIEAVTPGAVLAATEAQICTAGWAGKHRRSLTAAQKRHVLLAYRIPAGTKVAEFDHLIPLEVGGANGTANIWPMTSRADALRKDKLEDELHARVCDGLLDLATAQDYARHYWIWW
jgi:hypothetical protein